MQVTRASLLKSRVDPFLRALRGIDEGNVKSLHRTRVASRRIRELIPVLQLDSNVARKLSRRLRRVTSRLGTVRELDVLLLLIDELHDSRRIHRDALSRVAVAVSKRRDDERSRLFSRLPMAELRRIAAKLRRVADELAHIDAGRRASSAARALRWAVDARVARRGAKLIAVMEQAGSVYLPERLHAVRIALKKFRYAAELAANAAGEKKSPELRTLKRGQDALGRLHDLQVLLDRVRQLQATLTPPNLSVWRALDALVVDLESECRQLHARYMRLRPDIEAAAAKLLRGAGAPDRSRTDAAGSHAAVG